MTDLEKIKTPEDREPTRLTRTQFREALHEQFTQDPGKTRRVTFLGVGLQSEHQELLDV